MGHEKTSTSIVVEQFLCCTPINVINQTIDEQSIHCITDLDAQKEILRNSVNNALVKKYPVKESYQKAFLKWLMTKIEERGDEIHDDLYTAYCNLVSQTTNKSTHYRHFSVRNGKLEYITLQESTNIISEGTTGLCSWQGAAALSKWCEENRNEFSGKSVLELGCGVGLSGLNVISTCTPKEYVFSDCHHAVLRMVCENVKLNLLPSEKSHPYPCGATDILKLSFTYESIRVKVLELKWEEIDNYIAESRSVPDVIVAADVLYENRAIDALVAGLKTLLSFDARYAIIAATIRNADTISYFFSQLGDHNLDFEECALPLRTNRIQLGNSPIRILRIFNRR